MGIDISRLEFFLDKHFQMVHEVWIEATNSAMIAIIVSIERLIALGSVVWTPEEEDFNSKRVYGI
jgi:hypothetical protein